MAPAVFAGSLFAASPNAGLVDAAKNTDRATVRALLDQHADVNSPDADGATALHWAVRWDDLATAELLISKGANVKVANRYGVTALTLAATNGNAAMIELLLKAGAVPNTVLPGGETPLMTAARTGKADAVKVLLAHGADVNAKEEQGQTALMWAAAEGNTAAASMLLEFGADLRARSKGGFTPLLFAVREGRLDTAQALLKAGANVNETWQSPRRMAGSGLTALVLAVANAHYELASALLDAGADPNAAAQGWTALHQITWVRKPGVGTNNPAPQGSGNIDSLELVKRLVAHGADVNAKMTKQANAGTTELNMSGATPFLMAARTSDAELMRLLAKLGADPLLPNADNTTPIMAVAGIGTRNPGEDPGTDKEALEAAQVALELGADVNGVNKNGETAMHGTAYKELPSVAKLLIEHGAKVEVWNHKNKNGWTPLRIAEGVHRTGNLRSSPLTAAVLREAMTKAGVSTVVEPEVLSGQHPEPLQQ